jgi:N,N'-diacetyllegionaminate synthase
VPVEIIAEAGITHGGSLRVAQELADHALRAGTDCVKFQTYLPSKLLRKTDPDRLQLEKLALSFPDFIKLAKHCESIGIEFLSTPGELDSLKFLIEECGVKRIKIGSDDLTYKPLVEAAYRSGLPVILSTGMASLDEVFGALPHDGGFVSLTLMHCTSLYPCPIEKTNLRAINALRSLGYPVGYSDHTVGFNAAWLAMALGATIIEKHFCPNGYKGPDDNVSLIPIELEWFVASIKLHEKALGSGIKEPCVEELRSIKLFRKGKDGFRGSD